MHRTAALLLAAAAASLGPARAGAETFSNPATITVPVAFDQPASPFPSYIIVSGIQGPISRLTVQLTEISHTFPDDIDVLLVGPDGHQLIVMSDVGSNAAVFGVTLVLDDDAASDLPDGVGLTNGSYRPANYGTGPAGDAFPAPAPALDPTPATTLASFDGTDPNGSS